MIIAVIGGDKAARSVIIQQLLHAHYESVQCVSLLTVKSPARLEQILKTSVSSTKLTIVSDIEDAKTVRLLRKNGALCCHLFGLMSRIYDEVPILQQDYFITRIPKTTPHDHVLTPLETIAACRLYHKSWRSQAKG